MLPKELIDLEIDFAIKAAELNKESYDQALFKYTNLYGALFIASPERDENHPDWLKFLESTNRNSVYDYYVDIYNMRQKPSEKTYLGDAPSITYHNEGKNAYLHFNNNDTSGYSPLAKERMATRKQELRRIIQDIKQNYSEVKFINGDSWLYNIEAYKRLFPQKFIESGVIHNDFSKLTVWGQFLDRNENIRKAMAEKFARKIKFANTFDELVKSFPYLPIKTRVTLEVFLAAFP
jgi:hypothetical protein